MALLDVSPSVTVRSAAGFRQALLDALEGEDQLDLDVSELTEIDLSFIQLVLAARAQAERAGKTLRLTAPAGPALTALLDRAGLLTELAPADRDFWFHGDVDQ